MLNYPDFKLNTTYTDADCPIAAIEYKNYNLDNYIKFNDYIEFISENKERTYEKLDFIHALTTQIPNQTGYYQKENIYCYPVIDNHDYYMMPTGVFLITDKTCPNISTLPLFYQHELQYDLNCEYQNPEHYIKIRLNGNQLLDENSYALEYANHTLSASGTTQPEVLIWNKVKPAGTYFRVRVLLPYDYDINTFYIVEYDAYINGSTQKRQELINRKPIYTEHTGLNANISGHYKSTASGILLTSGTFNDIPASGFVYLQKEYKSRVFFKPFDNVLYPSGDSNWILTINPGLFIKESGIFETSDYKYNIPTKDSLIILSGEVPKLYNQNILKTTKYPLYITTSGYPSYELTNGLEIYINNEKLKERYIQSIDTEKGFIQLNKNITNTDIVYINYNINTKENYRITNVDLNPRNFTQFNILTDGISFVLPYSGAAGIQPSGISYIRTIDNPKGDFTSLTYGWEGKLTTGASASGILPSGTMILSDIVYKSLPTDIITITDCRRIGGGLKSTEDSKESEWYYDRGKWDGEILQSNSIIIIQIPSGVINYFIDKFYDNDTFTLENYNEQILLGTDPTAKAQELGFDDLNYYNATKEAYRYITDTVEKYLPVGTEYLILDEKYNLYNVIM